MTTPNLAPGVHRHTGAVKKLLTAFTAETGLAPREKPEAFSNWLDRRPKPKDSTKALYLLHASKLLDVHIPKPATPSAKKNSKGRPVKGNVSLSLDTYKFTIEKLQRLSKTNSDTAFRKKVALCLFVGIAITGYSFVELMTIRKYSPTKFAGDGLWSFSITLHPARRQRATVPVTHHYSGLNQFEMEQMKLIIDMVTAYSKNIVLIQKLQKQAFNFIATANPVKGYSLWDMRRIYPDVLGYKKR